MTVRELEKLLKELQKNGQVHPETEVTLTVNEDFADLDFVDPDGPTLDCPHGRIWLCGTSDEDHSTAWTIADADANDF